MALLEKYVGDDIPFTVTLDTSTGVAKSLDDYTDIIVEYSTNAATIKFSKVGGTGIITLTRISANEYGGVLTSAHTTLLGVGYVNFVKDFILSDGGDGNANNQSKEPIIFLMKKAIA